MLKYYCDTLISLLQFQAIVFVVGGGNYIEYQNLVDYLKVSRFLREPNQ